MMRPSSLQSAAPRRKAALTITDKDGNVINLTGNGSSKAEERPAEAEGGEETKGGDGAVEEVTKGVSSLQVAAKKDNSLLEAAKAAIAAGGAKQAQEAERKRKEEEEAAR
ncbi:hypothetical protein THAOC_26560, partial [Thalassiosira oceanica]